LENKPPVVTSITLPEAPESFGKMVALPRGHVGQNPKAWAAQCVAAVRQANGRLQNDKTFYDNLKDMYRQIDEGKVE
jgi:hypothetical protein